MNSALGGPPGWLLLLLSISVLTVSFERTRFWFLWWRRRKLRRHQWQEMLGRGDGVASLWIDQQDGEMRFAQPFLEAASVLGPLIGLIGTVLGLSRLLAAMGPQLVLPAGGNLSGFGEALSSTAMGLVVSLMATLTLHLNNGLRQWQLTRWQRELRQQALDLASR